MNKKSFVDYCLENKKKAETVLTRLRTDYMFEEQCKLLETCINTLDEIVADLTGANCISDKLLDLLYDKIKNFELSRIVSLRLPDAWLVADSNGNISVTSGNFISSLNSVDILLPFYRLLKAINLQDRNIVIVGANGAGKTTLASFLKVTIKYRDGVVISAQNIIVIPSYQNVPAYKQAMDKLKQVQDRVYDDKIQYFPTNIGDTPLSETRSLGEDSVVVFGALLADRRHRRDEYCEKIKQGTAVNEEDLRDNIDRVIDIWNDLICDRELFFDNDANLFKIRCKGKNIRHSA